jgi:hypothetical protein
MMLGIIPSQIADIALEHNGILESRTACRQNGNLLINATKNPNPQRDL